MGRGGSLLTQSRCAHPIVPGERNSSPSPSLRVRAIAYGETVAFLSSVIPVQAGIQCPKTRHSPLDSRLRGCEEIPQPIAQRSKCERKESGAVGLQIDVSGWMAKTILSFPAAGRTIFLHNLLRGNDGNGEVGEPECNCPAPRAGGEGEKSDFADGPPEMCPLHSRQGGTGISEGYIRPCSALPACGRTRLSARPWERNSRSGFPGP
jgi:hypothetical protein